MERVANLHPTSRLSVAVTAKVTNSQHGIFGLEGVLTKTRIFVSGVSSIFSVTHTRLCARKHISPKACQEFAWFLYQAMGIQGILVPALGARARWLPVKSG
jgi:hypothetical protein